MYTRAYIGIHTQAHMYDYRTGGRTRSRHKGLIGMGGGGFCWRQRPSTHTRTHVNERLKAHRKLKSKKIQANRASSNY